MSDYVSFMITVAVILSAVSIAMFGLYYLIAIRKNAITKAAVENGYDDVKQYRRDTAQNRRSIISWNIFLDDDARSMGLRYLVTSILFFFIAGTFGLTMRLSLTYSTPTLLTPDAYNVLLTQHATLMIYMWAVGSAVGLGYFLLPTHLKLWRDTRGGYASVAYWLWVFGAGLFLLSRASFRWYMYPPLSLQLTPNGGGLYAWLGVLGMIFIFLGIMIASVNILQIILFDRDKNMKMGEMSLFSWSIFFTVLMIIVSAPPIMVGLGMLFYDYFTPVFFTAANGEVLLFAILFWWWGHPIVYIAVIPFFGLIYELISKFTDAKVFSYRSGVFGLGLLTALSMSVFGHHLLNSGLGYDWVLLFETTSFAVVIPSAITVFNWIATLWKANKIRMTTPMLFVINGIIDFIIGGITGVMQVNQGLNQLIHGTYWVTGHFHFIFMGVTTGITFAAFYTIFPTISGGRTYNVILARTHFYLTAIGSLIMSFAWSVGGFIGMPRAVAGYFPWFQPYQDASILGGVIIGIGQLVFLYNMAVSWLHSPSTSEDNVLDVPANVGSKGSQPTDKIVPEVPSESVS